MHVTKVTFGPVEGSALHGLYGLEIVFGGEDDNTDTTDIRGYLNIIRDRVGTLAFTPIVLNNADSQGQEDILALVTYLKAYGMSVCANVKSHVWAPWFKDVALLRVHRHEGDKEPVLDYKATDFTYVCKVPLESPLPVVTNTPVKYIVPARKVSQKDYMELLSTAIGWRVLGKGRPTVVLEG